MKIGDYSLSNIYPNPEIGYLHLMLKAVKDEETAESVLVLSLILDEIALDRQIPLENKESILLDLHNAAHLEYLGPQSGYIFYNQNKIFVDEIKRNFPKFHTLARKGMKKIRTAINKPLTEDGLNYFIYVLCISWSGLIPELQKTITKVRVVVISDRHILHAHMIKNFIEFKFSEKIDVEIFEELVVDKERLEALDCDLILTNFPISSIESKEAVYIENVPSLSDLKKVQQAINHILESLPINYNVD